ncbi:MAG: endo,4-beta-xylanase [Actinomycetota bacterium]|nr:endo,4-beta-xylanase [Actinomycetota bacterium]
MRRKALLSMASAASVLLCGATALYATGALGDSSGNSSRTDLLSGQDWSHLAGAKVSNDGIGVNGLGRRIVQQDGSGGQANPPVNLSGPRLRVKGSFSVTATMAGVGSTDGYLHLYDSAPVVYDEWRQEPPGLRLGVEGSRVRVDVWDGRSDTARTTKRFGTGLSDTVTLTATVTGTTIKIRANSADLGTVPAQGILDSGTVLFGLDGTTGRPWTLKSLTAQALNGTALRIDQAPSPTVEHTDGTLRTTAAGLTRPFGIGTALASGPLLTDTVYRTTAATQFSMITPENDFKPQFLHPQPDTYAFDEGDALVRFAQANNIRVHAHTLVWHEALPAWMRALKTPDAVEKAMVDHVNTVAGHYRGKVTEWDVVNEPLSDEDADYTNGNRGLRAGRNPWFQALGEQYIDLAFTTAHRADPDADLYLNEYGAEEDGERWEALLALAQRLKARGVPIDGIGFQNHEYEKGDRTAAETFRRHVRKLASIGLKARISEMDVILGEGESQDVQVRQFVGKLDVCVEEPNCTTFGLWGFTDRYGSTSGVGEYPLPTGNALPWDEDLRPKKVYSALLERLRG